MGRRGNEPARTEWSNTECILLRHKERGIAQDANKENSVTKETFEDKFQLPPLLAAPRSASVSIKLLEANPYSPTPISYSFQGPSSQADDISFYSPPNKLVQAEQKSIISHFGSEVSTAAHLQSLALRMEFDTNFILHLTFPLPPPKCTPTLSTAAICSSHLATGVALPHWSRFVLVPSPFATVVRSTHQRFAQDRWRPSRHVPLPFATAWAVADGLGISCCAPSLEGVADSQRMTRCFGRQRSLATSPA